MLYVSPSYERILGYSAKAFIEDPELLERIILPEDRQLWIEHQIESGTNKVSAQEIQFRIRMRSGEIRWIEHAGQPVYNPDGEFLGVRGSNRDITKRKLAEEILDKSRQFNHAVLMSMKDHIAVLDKAGHILISPQEFGATYKYFLERIHPVDLAGVKEAVKRALDVPMMDYNIMHRIITPDGEERIVRARGSVTFNDQGKASHMIGTLQDVTDIRQMEMEADRLRAELSHLDRVSPMGVLTAGIAHEINQPLTAILSNAQAANRFLKKEPQDLKEVKNALQDIVSDGKRSGEMVHSIRNIMKRYEPNHQEIDLNETVREVIRMLKSEALNKKVLLSQKLQSDIPPVFGDRIEIQQVTLNLVINALEALS